MKAFVEARTEPLFIGQMTSYPYPMHVHGNVELACVLSGGCVMGIGDKTYELAPGDFAVVFPLVPHSFEHIAPGTRGFSSFFQADVIPEFAHMFHGLMPDEPVIPAARLNDDVHRLIEMLSRASDGEGKHLHMAYLHLLVAHVLDAMSFHPAEAAGQQELAGRTIQYIAEHACEKITLSSAARELGISQSHLSHLFSQQFHIHFRHFINGIRIDRAIAQMRDSSRTLTDICYACGFDSIRTFRRAFMAETGMLPSEYRQTIILPTPGED